MVDIIFWADYVWSIGAVVQGVVMLKMNNAGFALKVCVVHVFLKIWNHRSSLPMWRMR